MTDPVVDEVRRVRQELIRRYGGLEGYLKHCEAQERRHTSESPTKPRGKRRRRTSRLRRSACKR